MAIQRRRYASLADSTGRADFSYEYDDVTRQITAIVCRNSMTRSVKCGMKTATTTDRETVTTRNVDVSTDLTRRNVTGVKDGRIVRPPLNITLEATT